MEPYKEMIEEGSVEPQKNMFLPCLNPNEDVSFQMRQHFKKFFQKKSQDKFRAFVEWVELAKPPVTTRSIYSQIAGYQFYEQTLMVVQEDSEISCLAVCYNPNEKIQTGAVGFKDGSLLLINSKTGAILVKEQAGSGPVNAVAIDEYQVFTACNDNLVLIWNYRSKENTIRIDQKLMNHQEPVLCLAISHENVVSGDKGGEIFVWNRLNKETRKLVYAKRTGVNAVIISQKANKIFAGGDDFKIKVWNLADLNNIRTFDGHEEPVKALAISKDCELLASGGGDKCLKIWDLTKNVEKHSLEEAHDGDITCLEFMPGGKALISGSADKVIKLWSIKHGRIKTKICGHTGSITCFAINSKSSMLISGSEDKTIRGWNLQTYKLDQLIGSKENVLALATIPKSHYVLSSSKEKFIRVWNIEKARLDLEIDAKTNGVLALAVNEEGTKFASGGLDGSVSVWEIDLQNFEFRFVKSVKKHTEKITALRFSKSCIISGSSDQTLKCWDLGLSNQPREKKHPGIISALDVMTDESLIVTGTKFSGLYSWDCKTLKDGKSFQGHQGEITAVRVTTNGKLVSSCQDCTIKIWNVRDGGPPLKSLDYHEKAVLSLELNADHTKIFSGSEDLSVRIWDIETGAQIGIETGYKSGISVLAIDHLGSRIIFNGSEDKCLKILEFNFLKTIKRLGGYNYPLSSLAISPDERFLTTGDDAGFIRIWDLFQMNKIVIEFKAHVGRIMKIKFHPDNKRMVSCGKDNTSRVWFLSDMIPERKAESNERKCKILKNFSNSVNDVAFFQNGERACFGADDASFSIFNLETYEFITRAFDHWGPIYCLVVNESSWMAYTGGWDGKIKIYNLKHYEYVGQLGFHDASVRDMVLSHEKVNLMSCGNDHMIRIWNLKENTLIKRVTAHEKPILCIAINSVGSKLYTGSEDETIQIWDTRRFKRMARLKNSCAIKDIIINDDNTRIFSLSSNVEGEQEEHSVKIWDTEDSKQHPFCEGHFRPINRIELVPGPVVKNMITCSRDQNIIIWDLKEGKQKKKLKGHTWNVTSVALTSDGSKLVSCTYNSNVRIWDLKLEICIGNIWLDTSCWFVIIGPDNKEFVLACCDSSIRVYDLETKELKRKFEDGHNSPVFRVIFSPDKKKLVSCGDDQLIIIWDYEKAQALHTLEGHSEKVYALALIKSSLKLENLKNEVSKVAAGNLKAAVDAVEECRIVSGSSDKTLRVWNMMGMQECIIKGFPGTITDIIVTPDHRKLVIGCQGNALYSLEFSKLKKEEYLLEEMRNDIRMFEGVDFKISDTLITPDEKSVFAVGELSIGVWNFNTGKLEKKIVGFSAELSRQLFSPSKKYFIFATKDHFVTAWRLKNQQYFKIQPHTKLITSLLMTSNEDRLFTGSKDKTIGVINFKSKKLMHKLRGHSGGVNSLIMSPDEEFMFSASDDNTIRKWGIKLPNIDDPPITLQEYRTGDDVVFSLVWRHDIGKLMTGGKDKIVSVWDLEMENPKRQTLFILKGVIKELMISPDSKILICYLQQSGVDGVMQIWRLSDNTFVNEIKLQENNFTTMPVFLSRNNNRLILYFDQLIDLRNGETIFNFQTNRRMITFIFDFTTSSYFYLTEQFELFQLEPFWFQTYVYEVLKFDSITSLNQDPKNFIRKKLSTFPFFFSFLHMAAIFGESMMFQIEKLEHIYEKSVKLFHFFSLDIFDNTPLDILILTKNATLIGHYFNSFFHYFEKDSTTFFEKVGFLNYTFRDDYSIPNLLSDLIELFGEDLKIVSKILDLAYMPLEESIYDNSLLLNELSDPLFIGTDSVFMTGKEFISQKMIQNLPMIETTKEDDPKAKKGSEKEQTEENQSFVKAKVICLKGMNDITNPVTKKVFSQLAECDPGNEIFENETLKLLAENVWFQQLKIFYLIDFFVFFFFFMLYNINFIYVYPLRTNIYYDNQETLTILDIISYILNGLLIFYGCFSMTNEIRQMRESGFLGYFKSVWNYFDILTIPSLIVTSLCDINRTVQNLSDDTIIVVKAISAICMFCFWFRFLSYFRAMDSTSFMIRLIFQVVSATKYFILFMVIFMLSLACMFYLLHTDNQDENPSFWDTILVFWDVTTGDTSGISDYDLAIPALADFFVIISSFIFAIILLNLLVSIIGDIHGEINDAKEKTRLYELVNILCDTDFSLTTKLFRKILPTTKVEYYSVQLYNEKHEPKKINPYGELEKVIAEKINEAISANREMMTKNNERIDQVTEKMEKLVEDGINKIKKHIAEIKKDNHGSENNIKI